MRPIKVKAWDIKIGKTATVLLKALKDLKDLKAQRVLLKDQKDNLKDRKVLLKAQKDHLKDRKVLLKAQKDHKIIQRHRM